MPRRVSEGCGSAQPPIGRLANRRPRGQRAGQPPTPPPPPGQWRGCGLRRSPSRTLVPGPPAPAQPEGLRAEEAGRRVGAPLLFAGVGLSPPSRAGAPRERARSPVPRLCAWTPGRPPKTDCDGRKAGVEIRARIRDFATRPIKVYQDACGCE
ncbi:atherin-like isoform X1 [Ursus maritimus]|uniref:Atherin-like isoform X1 n=1 Tax=Ursus maritimus TaxID=29073 RepID=A0A8M1FB77_URSMA|nr:atherin-like isoform X1 [Ursus maritimus]